LSSRSWVESRHVGLFGEMCRARRTTRRFAEGPHLAFNFILYVLLGSITIGENPEVAEGTRRLTESLLDRLLFVPLNSCCTVTFGDLTLAHYSDSAIMSAIDFLCFCLNIF